MEELKRKKFQQYYEQYYTQVYRYIVKKTSNFSCAEDLAMDCFMSCYQKFDSFDPSRASFGTWLYVVVNNKLKNYYRDNKRTEELDESFELPGHFDDEVVGAEYLAGLRKHLAVALHTLSPVEQTIIVHKFFKNETAPKIAEVVGLSPVNVRVHVSRALKKLKEYFTEHGIEWEGL